MGVRNFILCFLVLSGVSYFAQNPAHYFIGDQKLSGIKIYDLIQDNSNDYWFATNQGLYLFDGYNFSAYENELVQNSSIFNLRKTEDGTIYFNDLKKQVFSIKEGKVELFHYIEGNEVYLNTFLETHKNMVYIQTESLTIIDGDTTNLDYDFAGSKISFRVFEDGSTFCASQKHTGIYADGKIVEAELFTEEDTSLMPTAWINVENTEYAIDQNSMKLYSYDLKTDEFTFVKQLNSELNETALRLYKVKDQIWMAGNRNGVFAFDFDWNELNNGLPLFNEYFISDVYVDHEENVLISTFDKGVMVVPDLQHKEFVLQSGAQIVDFSYDSDSTLFIGTSSGELIAKNIYSLQEKLLYTSSNAKPIEHIYYAKDQTQLLFSSPKGFVAALWTKGYLEILDEYAGSIKSATIDEKNCLVALNSGIKSANLLSPDALKSLGPQERAYDVAIDETTATIYAVYATGLRMLNPQGELYEENSEGEVSALCAETVGGNVYVGTANGSILVFSSDKLIDEIKVNAAVRVLASNGQYLFVRTLKEAFLLDVSTHELTPLKSSLGYDESKIIDAQLDDSLLVLSKSNKISIQPINRIEKDFPKLEVSIAGFFKNGIPTLETSFDYSSSSYAVAFEVNTIRYADLVKYRYQLKGFEEDWKYLDYTDHFVNFGSLPAGSYTVIVQAINGDVVSGSATFSFEIDAPFYQKAWFYFFIMLIIAIGFYVVYRIRIKAINKKNLALVEKQKMQTNLLEMELKALRSQMNPHFIFNSLNSIQNLVLKEDIDNSYDYLVLFAKLVRNTLNYSDLHAIPIEKEIEFLTIYLSLEQLRFKKDFTYEINYEGLEDFSVPPLIIQPFVENALVHGLLHKEGAKHLNITFRLGKHLSCIITDNGVGRAQAKAIAERSKLSEHKSFAMNAIQQRLDLLNKQLEEDAGSFVVEDLFENGKPVGTRVEVILPVERNY